jgi:hypothetical protein
MTSFSSSLRFLVPDRAGCKLVANSDSCAGKLLPCFSNGDVFVEIILLCDCLCLENIAWMPSFRLEIGSMKADDSVPTLPTSLGT